jgi:sigma-B regulation protein RsbU (phosphoserine phosphatase)
MGRVCLADIAGHGEAVAGLGVWLHRVFRSHVHRISPAGVLYAVNAHVHRKGYDAISTAVVLSYNSRNGKLRYAYAGHPRGLHYRRREGRWVFLNPPEHPARDVRNVPFGVAADTRYDVGLAGLRPGDRILFYSDGVTEVADSSGRRLGDKGLMGLLDGLEDAPPREAGEALLRALQGFAGRDDFQHDDVTFLLLDGGPFQRRSRLNLLVRNNLRKLLRGPKP